jgi:hypothetical protein
MRIMPAINAVFSTSGPSPLRSGPMLFTGTEVGGLLKNENIVAPYLD